MRRAARGINTGHPLLAVVSLPASTSIQTCDIAFSLASAIARMGQFHAVLGLFLVCWLKDRQCLAKTCSNYVNSMFGWKPCVLFPC